MASDSPLSRWASKPVLKDIRFKLSLDDPKVSRDEWIVVRGDRDQLAALCDSVSNYIQNFLAQSHDRLNLDVLAPETSVATLAFPTKPAATATQVSAKLDGLRLQPHGLLNHELHWGALATEETGAVTSLSTLQLFDLANALEDYSSDVLDLPELRSDGWVKQMPRWGQIAAVALIAVGLSTSAIKLLDGSQPTVPTVASSQGAASTDQQIATQISPAIVDKATPPAMSTQKLPPPPPNGSVAGSKPGMPTVTTPQLPTPAPNPGNAASGSISTYPVPVVPGRPTVIVPEPDTTATAKAPERSPNVASAPSGAESFSADAASSLNQRGATTRSKVNESAAGQATAFDTIPQVAEVRNYFEKKWQPPEGLSQTLEYSLKLDANGTIQTITPLKQASGDYIDRTGMPLLGDPFVSPLKGRQSAKVRLVLEPNGTVKAFLEE